jgi:hypothetical protein
MRIRALAVAPLLLLALAGCAQGGSTALAHYKAPSNGESRKAGPEVAADAAAALLHAGAATVEGHLTVDGTDQDVTFNLQGADMTGTVLTRGQAVQVVVWHDDTYAKGPASFWRSAGVPGDAAARLAGHWVRHAGTAVRRLTPISLIWVADVVRDPSEAVEHDVHLGRAGSGRLTGTPVAVVTLADGSTIQVAAAGTPYPLVIENPGGHDGELSLSAFEEGATVVPPASAVDLASAG